MTVVKWANPNVLPRRWNYERGDSLESVPVTNNPTFTVAITKFLSESLAADAGLFIGYVAQPHGLR